MTQKLYSYTLRYDDGAAPNPFHGMCTLTICKPAIRRTANPGDWVIGLGGSHAPSGDLSGRLIYAMRIDEVVSLSEYDRRAPLEWPHRIPNPASKHLVDRLGDCIYDYSQASPRQRHGVHGINEMPKDIRGENALISRHFYYFGSSAILLPPHLQALCHQTQGHKSTANAKLLEPFVEWLAGLELEPGQTHGWPDHIIKWDRNGAGFTAPCGDSEAEDEEFYVYE